MLPTANGLMGLIVIDSPASAADAPPASAGGDDATLGELLYRLTQGTRVAHGTTKVSRFAPLPRGMHRAVRVTADCRRLGDELEQAARQLRRQIAVAGRIAC